mgnify:CR=1 FL=1|tara:strand:+ start:436 stop:1158 length:723 start_codon:yes stop_codon:yes gene_type:complete
MNMFFTSANPVIAAQSLADAHIGKMLVETVQMCVSAGRRHGALDEDLPLTKAGKPHKGGYHGHPMTRWVGDCKGNFDWAVAHGFALAYEWRHRFEDREPHFGETQMLAIDDLNLGRYLRNLNPNFNTAGFSGPERIMCDALSPFTKAYMTDPPRCFGPVFRDDYDVADVTLAYRAYLIWKYGTWAVDGRAPRWTHRSMPKWISAQIPAEGWFPKGAGKAELMEPIFALARDMFPWGEIPE